MSRCAPYPPPGYKRNGLSGDGLIEVLEVRREKEKAQAKKERKREKREKRRRKENKGHLDFKEGEIKSEEQSHRGRHKHRRRKKSRESSDNQGKRENETEVLERSSVTEELEQAVSDKLYNSSDNSQNIKRKNKSSPNGCYNHGSIVWLDFQLQKHKDPEVLFREPGYSTSRTDFVVHEKFELAPSLIKEQFCSTYVGSTTTTQELAHSEMRHSSSQRIEASKNKKAEMAMPSIFSKRGMLKIEAQYKELIVDWVPPRIQSELSEFDDQEWLCERRLPRKDMTERSDASNDDLGCGSSTLYPCAEYLPQASIYALPFTIPF